MTDKPATKPAIEMITLKQVCTELKVSPREARERLRLAVRDTKKNPELAKSHKPGQAWEWPKNSPALKEVRAALTA
jgi:hypothetical protein